MRTIFSNEEMVELRKNPCVFSCTNNSVNYTYEFKKRSIELHMEGVTAREIWKRSGFNTDKWKSRYFKGTISDWKDIVKRNGIEGLLKPGGIQFDRGPDKTDKNKLKRLELQVKYLEAENDFLAKLLAKKSESNSGRVKNTNSSEN